MTTFIFNPDPKNQFANWTDPARWVGGVVPNSPTADVFFNTVYQNGSDPPSVYSSFVHVGGIAVRSVQLTDNYLLVEGSLSISNDLAIMPGGEIDMYGGILSAQSLTNDGIDIQGFGQINVSGTLTNQTLLDGGGLTVTASSLTNSGQFLATGGGLTVTVALNGFTNSPEQP